MRIGFVVQRYGGGSVGGAERFTMDLAADLAARGHEVEALTSRATSYATWADELPGGIEEVDGVTVQRLPVVAPRDNERFIPLHQRMVDRSGPPLWPLASELWARRMGPELSGGAGAVADLARRVEVVVFVGYHYAHSLTLLSTAAALAPTVLVPTAHPEGAFHAPQVRSMFDQVDRVVCLAEAEADLVAGLHGPRCGVDVIGCPVEPIEVPDPQQVAAARRRHGVGEGPYLVMVGRVDPAKGSDEAVTYTSMVRRAVLPGLRLVVIGPGELAADDPGALSTGFVEEGDKTALVAGATALLQPSYMESFSLVLMEAWLLGRPALVQGANAVLAGHVGASGGGAGYTDYPSFEAAVVALEGSPDLRDRMGAAGRAYVRRVFDPGRIAAAYEESFRAAISSGHHRLRREPHRSRPLDRSGAAS